MGFTDDFYTPGTRAVSAPVRGASKDVIAVVTVVAPSQRVSLKQIAAPARPIKNIADAISEDITRVGTIGSAVRSNHHVAR